jgi:hypothetical protein
MLVMGNHDGKCMNLTTPKTEIKETTSFIQRMTFIMDLVNELFLVAAKYDFHISALHLAGKKNLIADPLSRFNLQQFSGWFPRHTHFPRLFPGNCRPA